MGHFAVAVVETHVAELGPLHCLEGALVAQPALLDLLQSPVDVLVAHLALLGLLQYLDVVLVAPVFILQPSYLPVP